LIGLWITLLPPPPPCAAGLVVGVVGLELPFGVRTLGENIFLFFVLFSNEIKIIL
jgi:hypothetical protein